MSQALETQFVFAAVWAFGMALTVADDGADYRRLFSDWWRTTFKKIKFPTRDTVLDYWLNPADGKFDTWEASPQFAEVPFDSMWLPHHCIIGENTLEQIRRGARKPPSAAHASAGSKAVLSRSNPF